MYNQENEKRVDELLREYENNGTLNDRYLIYAEFTADTPPKTFEKWLREIA